ncbi:hypothetical protein V9L05_07025 [Bernardetia sp. Wsw4-3y2]|uniref:hypothetical protein n=1 Tax=Bernardetia sp. Wsw4-3y2 TaxID=3127471 RepID=UPI0030CC0F5A
MKKIITLLLLSLFSFHILGVYVSFQVREHYIKKDIKRRIKKGVPEEELAHIIYKPSIKNQFDWTTKAEFRYGGTMYDIVRTEFVNDSTQIFHCVNDSQETILFKDLEKRLEEELALHLSSKNEKKTPTSAKTLYKTLAKYVSDTQFTILNADWIAISLKEENTTLGYYFNFYHSLHLDIHSPPPRHVLFS